MCRRYFADKQRLKFATFAQVSQRLQQTAEVDRVLRQPAAAIQPHCDCVRGPLREFVVTIECPKCVDERSAVQHEMGAHDSRGQDARSETAQAANQVLRQYREPFLKTVVSGEANFELLEWLMVAVVASHQVRTDFVLQECVDTSLRHPRPATDQ